MNQKKECSNQSLLLQELDKRFEGFQNFEKEKNKLGGGTFGTVYKCIDNWNKEYALKVLDMSKICDITNKQKFDLQCKHIQNEVNNLSELNGNPNIIQIYHFCKSSIQKKVYLFLEYCNGYTLDKKRQYCDVKTSSIKKKYQTLSEQEVRIIFLQLLNAIKSLVDKNILHRDIKPQNILLHQSIVKLGDFGFSKCGESIPISQEYQHTPFIGTPYYEALEIMQNQPYSEKVDVYSLGITIFELLFGHFPFRIEKHNQ